MNWLRKIINRVKQAFAYYEGARFSTTRSIIPAGYTSARFDADCSSRSELARKMRFFERNDELVQALAGKFENFVVGANPQVTPNSSSPEWNAKAKAKWDQWCQFCDLTSRQNFGTVMNLAARRWFVEGDCFIVLTRGREQLGSRPRIQLIESHLCRTPTEFDRDPNVHDGVRMDEFGRPTSYYFSKEVERGKYEWGPPTDANFVIPIMEPERPGEVRGITHFHAAINGLHDLRDLHILEMQCAKENASVSDWIKTATGELDTDTLRRARLSGTTIDSSGNSVEETRLSYYQEITGGRAKVLKLGDEHEQNPGMRPSATTVEYWRLKRELVCAAVEIPYCIVFPDSMQGTVYRGALDMATASFKSRHQIIADAMRRIFEYVIGYEIKTDPDMADGLPKDWKNVSILPPRAPNVDVGRNATAEQQALADGRTNYDLIYGPLGLSWEVELTKLNTQLEFIKVKLPALFKVISANNGTAQIEAQEKAAEQQSQPIPIKKEPANA